MSDITVNDRSRAAGSDPATRGVPHLGWVVAGLSAAAGVIHFAMAPVHAADSLTEAIGFALAGWFQLLVAAAIVADRAGKRTYQAAVVGNLVLLGLWVWSRTAGLPIGAHPGEAEDAGLVDVTAALLQVGTVLLAARVLLAGERRMAVGRLAPALMAVAALGVATTVITSSDAASHGGDDGHHGDEVAAGADHHGTDGVAHDSEMASLDAERCDKDINHESYWRETAAMGIDTYQGGAMAADAHAVSSAGAATANDPFEGRGSAGLDELVSLTDQSGGGEVAAARLVSGLAEASDEDYEAWVAWMASMGQAAGGHGHDAAAPDDSGHGGHAGPSPWTAMTDPELCEQLKDELDTARGIALQYPTVEDALAAGWVRVTPYVPGIAAHYMNFGYVDGQFDLEEPEMLLYDGNESDSNIVGLSYYLIHDGEAEPTQGFTGPNDHFHRHVGLCQGAGGVIGDSSLSKEECEARGGTKADGSKGWMNHVWIVPGCESPWGMFSGASPVLDRTLSKASSEGEGEPGCAKSSVRERYGLDTGAGAAQTEPVTTKPGG